MQRASVGIELFHSQHGCQMTGQHLVGFFFLFFFKSVLANFIQFQTLVSISLEELCVQMLHSELGAV